MKMKLENIKMTPAMPIGADVAGEKFLKISAYNLKK